MNIQTFKLPVVAIFVAALSVFGLVACDSEAKSNTDGAKAAAQPTTPESKAPASAAKAELSEDQSKGKIINALMTLNPELKISSVQATSVDGIYQVSIGSGGVIHMDATGTFFFEGDLKRVEGKSVVNVTEEARTPMRAELLATSQRDEQIIFSPEGEVKASIAVFTDADCGFCQKLHKEVPALNAMGIEVRYLAYPRAGIDSPSYRKVASAWCSDNPQDALTKIKNRQNIPENVCEGNPVASQYSLGQKAGVTGTPSIILDSGEMIPGYMPADTLAARLGVK
ncbi:DsbC family protein [Teredinibacter waterburyi]|jgi:Protein-disulfide isomerase|uniref:DsbC family protein n=1 Tax=Teredinibacter waterburyi TaxID=1500538 RepID=UPI00165F3098|nr:DsbC family protein [Teredinibacter waterburyi]